MMTIFYCLVFVPRANLSMGTVIGFKWLNFKSALVAPNFWFGLDLFFDASMNPLDVFCRIYEKAFRSVCSQVKVLIRHATVGCSVRF